MVEQAQHHKFQVHQLLVLAVVVVEHMMAVHKEVAVLVVGVLMTPCLLVVLELPVKVLLEEPTHKEQEEVVAQEE